MAISNLPQAMLIHAKRNQPTMAAAKSFITLLLFISLLSLASCLSSASETKFKANVTVSNGLAFGFYAFVCPQVEILVRNHLLQVFNRDVGQAAGILRLHAHDCFVQVKLFVISSICCFRNHYCIINCGGA